MLQDSANQSDAEDQPADGAAQPPAAELLHRIDSGASAIEGGETRDECGVQQDERPPVEPQQRRKDSGRHQAR